ncbi:hypothetical protein Hanom_Chr09g00797501 [Helianthus anomalus]
MIRPIFTKTGTTSSRGGRPKVAFGPRPRTQQKQSDPSVFAPQPSTPRPSGSRPSTPTSVSRPQGAASSVDMQNFPELVRTQLVDVHRVVQNHQEQIKTNQFEILELQKKEVAQDQQITHLFNQSKRQAI